jgi:hypothetical protein
MAYLFQKDSLRQSFRLGFAGAWQYSHPIATQELNSIEKSCPILVNSLILINETETLASERVSNVSSTFSNSEVLSAFGSAESANTFATTLQQLRIQIPYKVICNQYEELFVRKLQQAYGDAYGIQNPSISSNNCKIDSCANVRFKRRYIALSSLLILNH